MKRPLITLLFASTLALPVAAGVRNGVEWRPWNGRLPANAIQGGIDQNGTVPLYICRARHINGVHPGKLLNGKCSIGWGGSEVVHHRFEVLVSTQPHNRSRDRPHHDERRR